MSATTPAPRRLPAPSITNQRPSSTSGLPGNPQLTGTPPLAEDPWLAGGPELAEDPWLAEDPGPPPPCTAGNDGLLGLCLPDDPAPEDPGDVIAWLDAELAKAAPWLDADPAWNDPTPTEPRGPLAPPGPPSPAGAPGPGRPSGPSGPGHPSRPGGRGVPVEVFKAGRWDRSRGDGGGFAAGGLADHLPPGPVLAGLAGDRWTAGLGRLSDDELIGVLRAARRLASWAAAMELAAAGDLWRRRTAEEDAGDTGAALHADAEVAAALTLTRRAADDVLNLAVGLGRLPATGAALAAGDIDLPRATVVADEVTGLTDEHAAAVDRAVARAAPGQTTGQLRHAARQAVLAADPAAAKKRKEQALREARVERWTEPAGTAALAGRDLPPAGVLAADANLTALAKQLKAAGADGTMDTLRAQIYLALLTDTPVSSLLPADPRQTRAPSTGPGRTGGLADADRLGVTDRPADPGGPGAGGLGEGGLGSQTPADTSSPPSASPTTGSATTGCAATGWTAATSTGHLPQPGDPGTPPLTGQVNLTLPLATWLGCSDAPGHAAGYGPLDATDAHTLADALAAHPCTQWCLTFTGPNGRPVAHGCARTGPPRRPHARPGTQAREGPWPLTFTLTPLAGGCDHALETLAYQPTAALRHLVNLRHATCVFPGCRRPAAQCDADHTLAYDDGGKTCLCNLAPLCRHHHQVKQTPGWHLEQSTPGILTWTTPSGRRYTIGPTIGSRPARPH